MVLSRAVRLSDEEFFTAFERMVDAMDMRYAASVGALKVLGNSGHVELSDDDFEFLTGANIWLAAQRTRARNCIEAYAFGALDIIGLPRFPLPAEFVACVIAKAVHPSNWVTASVVMSGVEWTENVILNREEPLNAEVLFSHILRIAGGVEFGVNDAEKRVRQTVSARAEKDKE